MTVRRVGRSSRCVTGRRPRDMRTTWSYLDSQSNQNRESSLRYAADQRRYCRFWRYGLQGGASVGTPWIQEENMGQEVPSLSTCLFIYLSKLQQIVCPLFSRMKWEIYIFIIIIIIIMSCRQHGYPWPSLATSPYHSSTPAGLLGYILCPHIAAVCKFGLVDLLLLGHMWGSIGVRHLRARPCFSSSVLRVWLV